MQNIKQIGALAHIEISDDEAGKFQTDLELVANYVKQLDELNLDDVEPTVHGQILSNVFREDVPVTTFNQDDALSNAPERIGNEFKVPKIVE